MHSAALSAFRIIRWYVRIQLTELLLDVPTSIRKLELIEQFEQFKVEARIIHIFSA